MYVQMGIKKFLFKHFSAIFTYYSNIFMTSNYENPFCKHFIFKRLQAVYFRNFA